MTNLGRNHRLILAVILLVGLALRLGWLLYARPVPVSDFANYYEVAAGILDHGQFGYPAPSAVRLPGWPMAMAILMLVSQSVLWLSLANVLLSTAACGMVYVLACQLTGRRAAALLAAAGCAVYPTFIFYSPVLASEQLYSVLLLGALIVIMRARQSRQAWLRRSLVAGALLGAACLTRGEAMIAAPFLALLLIHRQDRHQNPKRLAVVPALAMLAVMALVMIPWYVRNRIVMGSGAGLTTGSGVNLYFGHNPVSYGYHEEPNTLLDDPDEMVRNRAGLDGAMRYIRQNPASLWRSAVLGTAGLFSRPDYALTWSTRSADGALGHRPAKPLALIYPCSRLLAAGWWALAALAALAVLTIRRWAPWGLACVALYMAGSWICNAVIGFGCDRFRYPVDHLLIIAAAMTIMLGFDAMGRLWRRRS